MGICSSGGVQDPSPYKDSGTFPATAGFGTRQRKCIFFICAVVKVARAINIKSEQKYLARKPSPLFPSSPSAWVALIPPPLGGTGTLWDSCSSLLSSLSPQDLVPWREGRKGFWPWPQGRGAVGGSPSSSAAFAAATTQRSHTGCAMTAALPCRPWSLRCPCHRWRNWTSCSLSWW